MSRKSRNTRVPLWAGDTEVSRDRPQEVAVLVMGVTGCGKSSFISKFTQQDITVGSSLQACTAHATPYTFMYSDTKCVRLIDTPGFDDTHRSDVEILKEIALVLNDLSRSQIQLAGVLYLHRITDRRMSGASVKSLEILLRVCGDAAFGNITFVTTMWEVQQQAAEPLTLANDREAHLREKLNFWGTAIKAGASYKRHDGTVTSAKEIMTHVMEKRPDNSVLFALQVEMAQEGRTLRETTAGQYLEMRLRDSQMRRRRAIDTKRAELEESRDGTDPDYSETLTMEIRQDEEAMSSDARRAESMNFSLMTLPYDTNGARGAHQPHEMRSDRQGKPSKNLIDIARVGSSASELKQHYQDLRRAEREMQLAYAHSTRRMWIQRQLVEQDIRLVRESERHRYRVSCRPLECIADMLLGPVRSLSSSSLEGFRPESRRARPGLRRSETSDRAN